MPHQEIQVRAHDRDKPVAPGRVHIQAYIREEKVGPKRTVPLTFIDMQIEEIPGEIEKCSICHRNRPVYQRDMTNEPQCEECHSIIAQKEMDRRRQRKKDAAAQAQRWSKWP